jgi:VWFA-related protein
MFRRSKSGTGTLPRVAALILLISLTSFSSLGLGDPPPSSDPGEYSISVDVGLVVLPVIVTDRQGKAVSGLEADSFQVFEDGRPQQIALFEAEDVPVTAGLVIDNSGSMRARQPEVIAAAGEFARSSNPQDEMFVVKFNQRVSLGLPKGVAFTHDLSQLLNAVSRTPAAGNTALYDGLAVALEHAKAGTASRKALILISDGEDNASRLSYQALLKRAEAANVQIYTLGVFDEMYSGSHSGRVLKRLAKVTGGKAYFPASAAQIPAICQQIARDLRHQYTLGYLPSNPGSAGAYHAIRVTARGEGDQKLRVYTRAGYLLPPEPQGAEPLPAKASL